MSSVFRRHAGNGPVLFSVPHAGTECPDWLAARLTDEARSLPDTDWFVDRLFQFAPERDQSMLVARNTRYLIDLNRPSTGESLYPGQATTGLCPTQQFDGKPIYQAQDSLADDGALPQAEVDDRIEHYWKPYHRALTEELARIKNEQGYAVLFDCHSIASRMPRLFEGTLPVLNLGTNHGVTADRRLQEAVVEVLDASDYSVAVNGRFVGGTITRTYGRPNDGIHALQLEIGWDGYMSDTQPPAWNDRKAARLMALLEQVAEVLETWRPNSNVAR